jgi:hypothetical protein
MLAQDLGRRRTQRLSARGVASIEADEFGVRRSALSAAAKTPR